MNQHKFKRVVAIALAGVLSTMALTACSSSNKTKDERRELNLYTWEGMFPTDVLDDFTAKTGIKVNFSNFDTDETMLSKLETAKGGDYDVVIADDYIIQTAIEEDLVKKLDKEKIPNLGNVNPVYQGQFYDPTDEYTVPYGAGIQTIVYDPTLVEKEITGYADLWDPSLKGNIGVTGNYRVIGGMALKMAGKSYNTEQLTDIQEIGVKLADLAPNIRLIQDSNLQDSLLSGEIGVSVMYTSQVTQAKMANPNLKVVFPKEGLGFGIIAKFIPVNAPHEEEAYEFINYILDPTVSAKCFEHIGYYSTNKEADSKISEEFRDFLTLPKDLNLDSSEMIQPIGAEAAAEYEKMWTEFKTACGQ